MTTIVGDPITVADAIDHRDNHLDDTELAICGYGWSPEFPIPCPANLVDSPALDHLHRQRHLDRRPAAERSGPSRRQSTEPAPAA